LTNKEKAKMKISLALLVLLFFSIQIIEGLENYVLKFEKNQKEMFKIHFRSRAKFGSHFLKIHQFKNKTNSIQFSFFQKGSTIFTNILGNETYISKEILISSISNMRVFVYDEMYHEYQFNTTLMKKYFNSSFYLTCGVNYDSHDSPTVETSFNLEFENLDRDYFWDLSSKPNNVQFYHPAIFSVFLLIKMIELILCILFFKVQPLRSRGFLPILSILISAMLEIGQTYYFASFQFNSLYAEIIDLYVYLPFGMSVYSIIPLGFIHFLILTFIQRQKINFIQEKSQKMKIQFKILKWLSHPIIIVVPVLLGTLFFLFVTNFVYIFNLKLRKYIYSGIAIIIMFFFILLMLFDAISLILNYFIDLSKRKSNWKEKIFFLFYLIKKVIREDTYYFRIQYHLYGWMFITSLSFTQFEKYVWAYWLSSFIAQFSISGVQCEFILVVTIIKWLLSFKKVPVILRKDAIQDAMSNPELNEMLQRFCEIGKMFSI
jgi:hypothetical protein